MANEKKPNALAQYGPIVAPVVGVLLAVIFIAGAMMTNKLGEGQIQLQGSITKVRNQLESSTPDPGEGNIHLPDSVARSLDPGKKDDWKAEDRGAEGLLQLPIAWDIIMDAADVGEFDRYDESPKDGFWTENEFQRSPHFGQPDPEGDFTKWDRNGDGQISREEHADPPIGVDAAFAKKDTNGDKVLTAKDGEITQQEEDSWDRYPYDGKIDFQEFVDRYKPHDERDLGPVQNVEAKADLANMVIVVTWDNPDVADLPEDICFYIKRRAPETVERRRTEYGKKVLEYNKQHREWETRFKSWWSSSSDADSQKTNKQVEPDEDKAKQKYASAKSDPEPQPPEEVTEWETVTPNPVGGNSYNDTTFDTDVTYTYAVFMATMKNPKRGINVGDKNPAGYYTWPKATQANGHPVIVRNRIELGYLSFADPQATITLTKWHAIPNGDGSPVWYRVRVTEKVDPGDTLGGNYRLSDLNSRSVQVTDVSGTVVNPGELLPSDISIDFTTGFAFVTKTPKGFLLNSRELGDFELPPATKGPIADPTMPSSTENALEIRCLAMKSGDKNATFELTRWHQVGDDWVRVVMTVATTKGKDFGSEVKLSSPGSDVKVYDAAGNMLGSGDLKKYADETVDLTAGTYEGLEGRSFSVGGDKVDLFGTLDK